MEKNQHLISLGERQSGKKHDEYCFRIQVLAFLAMMINCAAEVEKKSERIEIIVDAVRKFWDVEGITGVEEQELLAFRLTLNRLGYYRMG